MKDILKQKTEQYLKDTPKAQILSRIISAQNVEISEKIINKKLDFHNDT